MDRHLRQVTFVSVLAVCIAAGGLSLTRGASTSGALEVPPSQRAHVLQWAGTSGALEVAPEQRAHLLQEPGTSVALEVPARQRAYVLPILVSASTALEVSPGQLKGFLKPVSVYNAMRLKEADVTPARPSTPLSPREEEVAALVARGLSNREIAKLLFIGERTVESHVQSILNKLGFHTRTQIAAWAVAEGLHVPQ